MTYGLSPEDGSEAGSVAGVVAIGDGGGWVACGAASRSGRLRGGSRGGGSGAAGAGAAGCGIEETGCCAC